MVRVLRLIAKKINKLQHCEKVGNLLRFYLNFRILTIIKCSCSSRFQCFISRFIDASIFAFAHSVHVKMILFCSNSSTLPKWHFLVETSLSDYCFRVCAWFVLIDSQNTHWTFYQKSKYNIWNITIVISKKKHSIPSRLKLNIKRFGFFWNRWLIWMISFHLISSSDILSNQKLLIKINWSSTYFNNWR